MTVGLNIELPRRAFLPGDSVEGIVHWNLPRIPWSVNVNPSYILVRLGWYTQGEGNPDLYVHDKCRWSPATKQGQDKVSFTLPAMPYSYTGNLMQISWCIAAETEDGLNHVYEDIIVGPNRKGIRSPS